MLYSSDYEIVVNEVKIENNKLIASFNSTEGSGELEIEGDTSRMMLCNAHCMSAEFIYQIIDKIGECIKQNMIIENEGD